MPMERFCPECVVIYDDLCFACLHMRGTFSCGATKNTVRECHYFVIIRLYDDVFTNL